MAFLFFLFFTHSPSLIVLEGDSGNVLKECPPYLGKLRRGLVCVYIHISLRQTHTHTHTHTHTRGCACMRACGHVCVLARACLLVSLQQSHLLLCIPFLLLHILSNVDNNKKQRGKNIISVMKVEFSNSLTIIT